MKIKEISAETIILAAGIVIFIVATWFLIQPPSVTNVLNAATASSTPTTGTTASEAASSSSSLR